MSMRNENNTGYTAGKGSEADGRTDNITVAILRTEDHRAVTNS